MNHDGQDQAADDDRKRRPNRIHVPGRRLHVRHQSARVQEKREGDRGLAALTEAEEVSEGKGDELKELDDQEHDLDPIACHRPVPVGEPGVIDRMVMGVGLTKELSLLMVVEPLSGDQIEIDREHEAKEGRLDRLGRRRPQGGHECRQADGGSREEEQGKGVVGSGRIDSFLWPGGVLVHPLLVQDGHQADQRHPEGRLDLHRQVVDQHIDLLLLTHCLLSPLLRWYLVPFCVPEINHKGSKKDKQDGKEE